MASNTFFDYFFGTYKNQAEFAFQKTVKFLTPSSLTNIRTV